VLGPSTESTSPRASRPFPKERTIGSPGVSFPTTHPGVEDPVFPGVSTLRLLPPSGFGHPLGGLLPSAPGDGPSTAAAPMGFALQGLAPPGRRCPSRGLASPVVFPRGTSPHGRDSRDFSDREGDRRPRRKRRGLPSLPSWDSAPPGLSPVSPLTGLPAFAPPALSTGNSPYGKFPGGAPGVANGTSGWSLSRLPALLGFCTFPIRRAS
jgi:hypothetical protein